tara:strand:- start:306 stop:584 length:279 start_codon:yes stop_codon:yes gene_type:complete
MGLCYLCEKKEREGYWCYFCSDCRKLKHYISIYGDRTYEILDNVLARTQDKQEYKIKEELKKDIENKEQALVKDYALRSAKKEKKKVQKLED